METFVSLHIDSPVLERIIPQDALRCIVKKKQNDFPLLVEEENGKYWTNGDNLQIWFTKKFSWMKGIVFNKSEEKIEIPFSDCEDMPDLFGPANCYPVTRHLE